VFVNFSLCWTLDFSIVVSWKYSNKLLSSFTNLLMLYMPPYYSSSESEIVCSVVVKRHQWWIQSF
jgi:hypothetical protein